MERTVRDDKNRRGTPTQDSVEAREFPPTPSFRQSAIIILSCPVAGEIAPAESLPQTAQKPHERWAGCARRVARAAVTGTARPTRVAGEIGRSVHRLEPR